MTIYTTKLPKTRKARALEKTRKVFGEKNMPLKISKRALKKLSKNKTVSFNEIAYQLQLPRHSDYCIFYEITDNDWKILLDINENFSFEFLASEYKRITNELILFMSYGTSITIMDPVMMKNIIKSNGINSNLYSDHFTEFNSLEYNVSILMLLKSSLLQISNSLTPRIHLFEMPTRIINDFFSNMNINFNTGILISSLEYYKTQYKEYKNIVSSANGLTICEIYDEFKKGQNIIIENNIIFNAEYCYMIIELIKFMITPF
jgi:hypothetical protein